MLVTPASARSNYMCPLSFIGKLAITCRGDRCMWWREVIIKEDGEADITKGYCGALTMVYGEIVKELWVQ